MSAIMTRRRIPAWSTLFLIDEASQLGNFAPLVQATTLGRGYGVRVHSFWQDLSQLMLCYPTEWRTIINNCGVKQIFGMTDPFMAQGLDELFQVPLRELVSIPANQQLLLISGETTRARKLDYLKDSRFRGLFDPNPYHGGDWPDVSLIETFPRAVVSALEGIAEQQRSENDDNRGKCI